MVEFDPTKPVQTRTGGGARILCTDFKGLTGESIVAALMRDDGKEELAYFFEDGTRFVYGSTGKVARPHCDLINVPVKKWKWVFRYPRDQAVHREILAWVHEDHWFTEQEAKDWAKRYGQELVGRINETEITE